jgi:uncharacterized protein YbjT (DUF2867 family)
MKVLLFGATGMIGQGVLRECLLDPDVETVVAVLRSASGQQHPKLLELLHNENQLSGLDVCFFCLGVSSAGMTEEAYERITYGFTLAAARVLARLNPNMTFIYVSGAGADSSEHGRSMWARVKGKTENELLRLPFKAYIFRPAVIIPLYGIQSRTNLYRVFYRVLAPVLPLLTGRFPKYVTTTEQIGRAMLKVARHGWTKRMLEMADINQT